MERFADNELGEMARWIVENEPCVGCGGVPSRTVDFDVLGEADQLAVCGSCASSVADQIRDQLRSNGVGEENVAGTIGSNGHGRA